MISGGSQRRGSAMARFTQPAKFTCGGYAGPAPAPQWLACGQGAVVQYSQCDDRSYSRHERVSREAIASQIAALKGYDFVGSYDPEAKYPGPLYFVPNETLVGATEAGRLGILSEHDLFGAVVPYPFAATKTITHPLIDREAFAPEGWSHEFPRMVENAVLFGFSAFTPGDARRAGRMVLERGAARLKPARGVGGHGQIVVRSLDALDAAIDRLDIPELSRFGIVIEQNYDDIITFSIGQVRIAELVASYCGVQTLTADNHAARVYGGSELVVARGDYDELLEVPLSREMRDAIGRARVYDDAAAAAFPGFMASRRNYDVAGVVDQHRRRSGVLEQSWRVGGASAAELAALQAFRADGRLTVLHSTCKEVYGAHEPPPGALVYFRGVDETAGPMVKYAVVADYV